VNSAIAVALPDQQASSAGPTFFRGLDLASPPGVLFFLYTFRALQATGSDARSFVPLFLPNFAGVRSKKNRFQSSALSTKFQVFFLYGGLFFSRIPRSVPIILTLNLRCAFALFYVIYLGLRPISTGAPGCAWSLAWPPLFLPFPSRRDRRAVLLSKVVLCFLSTFFWQPAFR